MLIGTLLGKCVCLAVALYAYRREVQVELWFRPVPIPQALVSVIAVILIGISSLLASRFLADYLLSPSGGLHHMVDVLVNVWSKLTLSESINFLGAVVLMTNLLLVPMYEEFMFRSVLHAIFRKWFGERTAILFVAIVFSLFHLDIPSPIPVPAFIISIALSMLALRTRSLIPGCIAHGVINYAALIFSAGQRA